MIVVNIVGGLGNQMFQYAFARAKALKHKTSFRLDPVYMYQQLKRKNFTLRNYGLNSFNIVENYTRASRLAKFLPNLMYILCKIKNIIRKKINLKYYSEKNIGYDKNADILGNGYYFDGYWQNERYFKDFAGVIKKDFTLKNDLSDTNKILAEKIKTENSVSIHVRRGDYIKLKLTDYTDEGYFQRAIKYIKSQLNDPKFYIFSDDIEYCMKEFIGDEYFFINGNSDNPAEDLVLMSICKHNIIANSSFSWWAAWLNNYPQKIVLAPKMWNKDAASNNIILNSWITI